MIPHSRQTIHMGINYVFSPVPVINRLSFIRFQQNLMDRGIDFTTTILNEPEIVIIRDKPTRLEIRVVSLSQQPVAQFVVVAPHLGCDLEPFVKEVEAVVEAFDRTWQSAKRQVISCDSTFRDLYETSEDHAFKEIWEVRLGQSANELQPFGRRVLGGGLRFVMPPQPEDPEPVQIEVKVESFLKDTHKLFIETQFTWPSPMQPGEPFDPKARLSQVDNYIEHEVKSFLLGGADGWNE